MIQSIKIKTNDGLTNWLCSVSSQYNSGSLLVNSSYPRELQQEVMYEVIKTLEEHPQKFLIILDVVTEARLNQLTRDLNFKKNSLCGLTKREKSILSLVRKGMTTKEIAVLLCISNETVKSHRKNILLRTGYKDFLEIIEALRQIEDYEFLFE